jgi:hypothetical protein
MRSRRRKPANRLGYMPGSVRGLARDGFKTIIVHCVGTHPITRAPCHHQKRLGFAELPDETWADLYPWFRCTECGNAGYVSLAIDWSEKLDFATPTGQRPYEARPQR